MISKHTNDDEISEYMVKAYNSVVEVKKLQLGLIKQLLPIKEMIQMIYTKHYLVYFDGFGAYEFISTDAIQGIDNNNCLL